MKNKKMIALTTATVISANMIPTGLLYTFAEESTSNQNQVQEIEALDEEVEALNIEAKANIGDRVTRKLTVDVNGYDSKFMTLDGLDTNSIEFDSTFEYSKSF